MSYTRIFIYLSLVALFQQTVVSQCLPLGRHAPIDKEQCRKALATYKFDEYGRLDDDGFQNKKTCGNCKIGMSITSTDPKVQLDLDGFLKPQLEAVLEELAKTCNYKGSKGKSMIPSIWAGGNTAGTFSLSRLKTGDMKRNECSSTPRKRKKN
ncbi:secreted protein [Melampsora americana]|nr:secreted protein [Melampsora americana]